MLEIDHFYSELNLNILVTFFQKAVIQRWIEFWTRNQSHMKLRIHYIFRIWKKLIDIFDRFWVMKVWKSDVCDNRNFEIFGTSLSRYKWRSLWLNILERHGWQNLGSSNLFTMPSDDFLLKRTRLESKHKKGFVALPKLPDASRDEYCGLANGAPNVISPLVLINLHIK